MTKQKKEQSFVTLATVVPESLANKFEKVAKANSRSKAGQLRFMVQEACK